MHDHLPVRKVATFIAHPISICIKLMKVYIVQNQVLNRVQFPRGKSLEKKFE